MHTRLTGRTKPAASPFCREWNATQYGSIYLYLYRQLYILRGC